MDPGDPAGPLDHAALHRLFEALDAHAFIVEIDPERGYQEVYTGPGEAWLLGGEPPPGTPDGAAWSSRVHPDDREEYDAAMRRAQAGEPVEIEYRLQGYDGVTRWIRERGRPHRTAEGRLRIDGLAVDVTGWRLMVEELERSRDHLVRVVGSIDEILYTVECAPDGALVERYVGPGAERLLGGPLGAPLHEACAALLHPEDRTRVEAAYAERARGLACAVEFRLHGLDGVVRTVSDRGFPRTGEDGRRLIDGVLSDVSERRAAEDALLRANERLALARDEADRLARLDSLTGLYNRRHFGEVLGRWLAGDGPQAGGALLLLDVDHFKAINDRHGHLAGDAVLVEIARRLQGAVRSSDCVARWGGEEFAILAPLSGAEVDVRTWAEGVRRAVSDDPVAAGGELQRVNVSIGVALAAAERALGDALVEAADRALYAAKRRGRDQVCLISELSGSELADDEPESIRVARALSLTASVREGIGEEHADQVASLAVRVARELGLPESVVSLARLVGWLHDVGKVAIPESVLGKPGPLDEDEWLAMRTHPAVGESIVSHVDSLRAAAAGVRHHHERFDGGGYPDGLAGISIPIEARIVAAADAYSAITQDRVYAPARSREEAIAELERSAGTHLDPAVVTALVAVLRPSPTALRLFDAA